MKFYSTRDRSQAWDFKDVIIQGLAPDGGLFMPERIKPFEVGFFKNVSAKPFNELSFDVAKQLLGDLLPDSVLHDIVDRTVNFDVPLVQLDHDLFSLELYHGPTLAFKDFGARFLS